MDTEDDLGSQCQNAHVFVTPTRELPMPTAQQRGKALKPLASLVEEEAEALQQQPAPLYDGRRTSDQVLGPCQSHISMSAACPHQSRQCTLGGECYSNPIHPSTGMGSWAHPASLIPPSLPQPFSSSEQSWNRMTTAHQAVSWNSAPVGRVEQTPSWTGSGRPALPHAGLQAPTLLMSRQPFQADMQWPRLPSVHLSAPQAFPSQYQHHLPEAPVCDKGSVHSNGFPSQYYAAMPSEQSMPSRPKQGSAVPVLGEPSTIATPYSAEPTSKHDAIRAEDLKRYYQSLDGGMCSQAPIDMPEVARISGTTMHNAGFNSADQSGGQPFSAPSVEPSYSEALAYKSLKETVPGVGRIESCGGDQVPSSRDARSVEIVDDAEGISTSGVAIWGGSAVPKLIVAAQRGETAPQEVEATAQQWQGRHWQDCRISYERMSINDLKLEIRKRGLDCVFCFSREDLVERLCESESHLNRNV